MNNAQLKNYVDQVWESSVIPKLSEYVRIPCKSVVFDNNWEANGYIDQAADLMIKWCKEQNIPGLKINLHRLPGKTPVLLIEIPGQLPNTVLLYGHMDKQPEMTGWHEGLGPWEPVIKNNRLYGRGSADDGYAVFAAITAIKALQEQNIPHGRCVILVEASEESGSPDLPFYIDTLSAEIATPELVICLDSGCGNYDQLWCTTSLRGLVAGVLTVEILQEGVHSGASGVVPSSFRILRQLLSRIEDQNTGEILLKSAHVDIPRDHVERAQSVANVLKEEVWSEYPWVPGAQPMPGSGAQLILNRTWRPALSIIGMGGIPSLEDASNAIRAKTAAMLSLRIPPSCEPKQVCEELKTVLEAKPPYSAKVRFEPLKASKGWSAPATKPWLTKAIEQASQEFYGDMALYYGDGGSIPFMGMLGEKYPQAQFMIVGVLGPHSNAHGPNEFLDIPTAKKLTASVAFVLNQHYQQLQK